MPDCCLTREGKQQAQLGIQVCLSEQSALKNAQTQLVVPFQVRRFEDMIGQTLECRLTDAVGAKGWQSQLTEGCFVWKAFSRHLRVTSV